MSDILAGLTRRLQNVVQVMRTTVAPIDSGPVQTVQAKSNSAQTRDNIPVTYHYGFSAHIPVGSDIIVLNVSGDGTKGMVISSAHQGSRPKNLTDGQVMLYDLTGSSVLMDGKGGVVLTASGGTVTINGKLVVTEDATIGGITFLAHEHSNGNDGNATGAPIAGT
ncbi:hypothetical protein HN018_06935 [Lichenicola cladoniae]|uniref:Bacteriophage Mu Gp45 N-terminal domain-containing protein n=1 Tax=Lichenicola cladoniae TaxID=1484109 RepID=A0A6M8HND2_9PROT|nr:phage baseplate assembly protein [Lichenicola cladoniae]NPD67308.1 hypothetical protein [Acetobacteraceae bacterium]QKE89810.1 hypothetical protein HN018_06935 [Lichenicola cladoniae]